MKINFLNWFVNTFIFAVFLLMLVYALLLANGFKINFQQIELAKTGLIYITGSGEVDVFIDQQRVAQKIPAAIPSLLPGRYFVELQRDGFQNKSFWVKVQTDLVSVLQDGLWLPENDQLIWQTESVIGLSEKVWGDDQVLISLQNDSWYLLQDDFKESQKLDLDTASNLVGIDRFGENIFLKTTDGSYRWLNLDNREIKTVQLINRISEKGLDLIWHPSTLYWGTAQKLENITFSENISLVKPLFWQDQWLVKIRLQNTQQELLYLLKRDGTRVFLESNLVGDLQLDGENLYWINDAGQLWHYAKQKKRLINNYWDQRRLVAVLPDSKQLLFQLDQLLLLEDFNGQNSASLSVENLHKDSVVWYHGERLFWLDQGVLRFLNLANQ